MVWKGKHIGGIALAGAATFFLIKKLSSLNVMEESEYESCDEDHTDSEQGYDNDTSIYNEEYDNTSYDDWEEPFDRQPYVPCSFKDGITKYDFFQIVKKTIRKNERIVEIKVFDARVYGLVRSQSGKSGWRFVLDFNDNGHITGYYQCRTRNDDSQIPIYIGNSIKEAILQRSVG